MQIPSSHALVPVWQHRSMLTPELCIEFCEWIANGGSMRAFCAQKGKPDKETIRRWLRANATFRAQYARARKEQAEAYAEEIVEIADTEPDPQIARVRIDARKWVSSKLLPKVYGDKTETTHTLNATDAFVRMLQSLPGSRQLERA